jgi:CCR4-NOT transcriptional complex subunit CAF120
MHPLNPPLIQKPLLTFFVSNKAKDRKTVTLSLHDVTQVFAVYPERPELITRSTLIKMEGRFGDEEAAAGMRRREGWLLMMPEVDPHKVGTLEMLKWVVGTPRVVSSDDFVVVNGCSYSFPRCV